MAINEWVKHTPDTVAQIQAGLIPQPGHCQSKVLPLDKDSSLALREVVLIFIRHTSYQRIYGIIWCMVHKCNILRELLLLEDIHGNFFFPDYVSMLKTWANFLFLYSLRVSEFVKTNGWPPFQSFNLFNYRDSIIKRKWLLDHLIFILGFPMLVRWHLYIEMPCCRFMVVSWSQTTLIYNVKQNCVCVLM